MKNFELTPAELSELRKAHKTAKRYGNTTDAYKLNATLLLGTGWTRASVSEALLLDEETLTSYVRNYKKAGVFGLLNTKYKGKKSHLNESQLKSLNDELEDHIHLTTSSVIEFVRDKFEISYSKSGMRDLLHRIGYEYKKPKLVPGNPDIEAQEIFVEQYDAFMKTKPGDVEVLFMDAVHPEHNTMAAYGWIKRGKKKTLKTNSGRQHLNLHGAINAETLDVTVIEAKSVNTDSTIDLLATLEQKYPLASKLVVILDNARYHYSRSVREALKSNPIIQLVFLPPYAPNLNLIERLWKFFKKKVLYNRYHESLQSFSIKSLDLFLRSF